MSDHNFEKQIKQKLEELEIPPADTVWWGVEEQIRKDKRRRRGIIFFPVFLLLIGASGYFIFEDTFSNTQNLTSKMPSSKSDTESSNSSTTSRTLEEKQDPNELSGKPATDKIVSNANDNPQQSKESSGNQAKKINNSVDADDKLQINHNSRFKKAVGKKYTTIYKKAKATGIDQKINTEHLAVNKNIDEPKSQSSEIDPKVDESIDSEEIHIDAVPYSQDNKATIEPLASPASDSIVSRDKIASNKPADSLVSTISEIKNQPIKTKYSNWKWGVTASAGISNLVDANFFNGVLGGEKALVADVSTNPSANAPNTSGSVVIHKPSAIEKGFSFSLGGFVQKALNKKFSMSTGIRYSYYSTHIRVGNRIDSSRTLQNAFGASNVIQYYRATPVAFDTITQKYTNNFHLAELPISVHMRLNKGRRLPIFWNSGIILSYLFSTNTLHFDSGTGVYYEDNSLFNKFQANLSTGFSISLFNSSKRSLDIGPQFQYCLSTLMKGGVSPGKHLYYYGINAKIYLKK